MAHFLNGQSAIENLDRARRTFPHCAGDTTDVSDVPFGITIEQSQLLSLVST
jgi:hypothetical protein